MVAVWYSMVMELFGIELYGPLSEVDDIPDIWDQIAVKDFTNGRISFHFIKDINLASGVVVTILSMTGATIAAHECYLMYPVGAKNFELGVHMRANSICMEA